MSDLHVPRRVPLALLAAALWPTAVLVVAEVGRELSLWTLEVGLPILLLVWAASTVPPLLIAAWIVQSSRKEGSLENLAPALEALGRAERLARDQAATLARVEEALARRVPLAEDDARASSGGARLGVVLVVAVGFLVASAGLGVAFFVVPHPPEPVHVHATFAVFAEGERVAFTDPAFDLSQRGNLRGHLHAPDGELLHIEGPGGATLAQVLEWAVGARLDAGGLALDAEVHEGRALVANATHPLRVFVAHGAAGAWAEADARATYVPLDGDRILLTHGPLTPEELERETSSVTARTAPLPPSP